LIYFNIYYLYDVSKKCTAVAVASIYFNAERTSLLKEDATSDKEISLEDSQEDYSRIAVRARARTRDRLLSNAVCMRTWRSSLFFSRWRVLREEERGRAGGEGGGGRETGEARTVMLQASIASPLRKTPLPISVERAIRSLLFASLESSPMFVR
jgi:hypothetical protein